ncbi:MAG: response regulator [Phycisphaerales bacterium]
MPDGRPRLLILNGPHVHAGDVAAALSNQFEAVQSDAETAIGHLRSHQFQAILADTGDYLPLERELVGQQASVLLNALGEGVCLSDADGRITWCNQRFATYDSPTKARIGAVCRQAARWVSERDMATLAGPDAEDARRALSRRYEVASEHNERAFEVMVSPVFTPGDSGRYEPPRHVAAVVWDVTATRRQQAKQAAIDAAGDELVRLDAELIRKMHTGDRLRVIEEKIVRYAHDLLHFDHFAVRLIEEKTGKLELVMSKGLPPAAMGVSLLARRDGNGISGFVAATGKSYLCADTNADERYVIGIESARSSLTVPLRMHDKVIGIFNVESQKPSAFNEEDRQFAESFATHIALALHMLNLLVVERVATGQTLSGNVEGELSEPLDDITLVVERLRLITVDPGAAKALERIVADVDSIRKRVKDVASGPTAVLGAEKALTDARIDPIMAGKRVLVVDDDPRIRQVVRDVLRSRGADVVMCENGTEALRALQGTGQAGGGGPGTERQIGTGGGGSAPRPLDLLVSDIKMPDMTGYDIFTEARKYDPTLPVILMTGFGYDPNHSIVRASQEGLQCTLFKPFQAERLVEEVHKALAKRA